MPKKRFLASLGVAAALAAGGVAAAVVGTTGISGAQTESPTTTAPATGPAPAPDGTAPAPDGPRSRENCPDKAAGGAAGTQGSSTGAAGATGISTQLGFRGGGGRHL